MVSFFCVDAERRDHRMAKFRGLMSNWRHPAVPLAVGIAAGILIDRFVGLSLAVWISCCFTSLITAFVLPIWLRNPQSRESPPPTRASPSRVRSLAPALCIACCAIAIGGLRHHLHWTTDEPNSIAALANADSFLCSLVVQVDSDVRLIKAPPSDEFSTYDREDISVVTVRCESIMAAGKPKPVDGLVDVMVDGQLETRLGDRLQVLGRLSPPSHPGTFGQFDASESLRRKRVRAVLRCKTMEAIQQLPSSEVAWTTRLRQILSDARAGAERKLKAQLDADVEPIASAMLLGIRTGLTSDMRDDFVESGTMHLLAISGLHVGILATFLWVICHLLGLPARSAMVFVLSGVLGYALLADARPSVVRATILVILVTIGRPWYRTARMENSLAIAAAVILLWNPTDLFDVGAQLSFLAVMGIAWSQFGVQQVREDSQEPPAAPPPKRKIYVAAFHAAWFHIRAFYRMIFGVWLFTTPLVAAVFNIVAPVGLIINLLLMPLVFVTLWSGYLLLISQSVPFVGSWVSPLFAAMFTLGMRFMLWIVDLAAGFQLGHVYVPGTPTWWLWGYYALLFTLISIRSRQYIRRWLTRGLITWIVVGLSVSLIPKRPDGVRYTFLSVGQGLSILIECRDGRTILYDAGSLPNRRRAEWAVQELLWHRGITRLDAVIVSHADVDHFNGMPRILENIPVGQLLVARSFLDFDQKSVAKLCEVAFEQSVPIRLLHAGQSIFVADGNPSSGLAMRIIHPEADPTLNSGHDNANSIVAVLEYANRRVLLTGDVERSGLNRILNQPAIATDVLLAPHHGSKAANPPELNTWAKPGVVIQSGGRAGTEEHVRRIYADSRVLNTRSSGTITVSISPSGQMLFEEFRREG